MKEQILSILRMQAEGKLTQDQAADLLAALADSGEEKAPEQPASVGAPGPRGPAATFNRIVDSVAGVGSQVGRAAGVWGGEILSMVHREDGGNSVTLSKVETPAGEAFTFENNAINVSTLTRLAFHRASFSSNSINASKLTRIAITDGKFSQCAMSGSSFDDVLIEGLEGAAGGGIRGVSFTGSKCVRLHLIGGSALDACTLQASSLKDFKLAGESQLRGSWINDCTIALFGLEQSKLQAVNLERSTINDVVLKETQWDQVTISGSKLVQVLVSNCSWKNVKIRREGSRHSTLESSAFNHCNWNDCEFIGCKFKDAKLRNIELSGAVVRSVDFAGLELEGTEAFKKAAGL